MDLNTKHNYYFIYIYLYNLFMCVYIYKHTYTHTPEFSILQSYAKFQKHASIFMNFSPESSTP
jgi:hypothetical protein